MCSAYLDDRIEEVWILHEDLGSGIDLKWFGLLMDEDNGVRRRKTL